MSVFAKPPPSLTDDEKTAFRGGAWCSRRMPDVENPYEDDRLASAWLAGYKAQAALAPVPEEETT